MKHMPNTLTRLFIHLIFATGERRNYLQAPELRSRVHEYLGSTLRGMNCGQAVVGGVSDHVHLLFDLDQNKCLSDVVRELKKASTR